MSRSSSGCGRPYGNATAATAVTAPGTRFSQLCSPMPTPPVSWTGPCRSTRRSSALTNTPRPCSGTQGAGSNYKNLLIEPPDHALGRSRGGLGTEIHQLVDGHGRPLVVLVGPGQAGDAPMFAHLMSHLSVGRVGPGRPRTRPERVRADKAYSSRAIRAHLRRRRIVAVIPEPADQQGHRKRRGTRGGRPPAFDRVDYRGRNVVERGFCEVKQWRGLATRYDKLALTYRGGVALKAIVTWLRTLEVISERGRRVCCRRQAAI